MSATTTLETPPPRLLDQLRMTAQQRGHSEQATAAMVDWSRRFILFHGKRHPREMGVSEVGMFLQSLPKPRRTRCVPSPRAEMPWISCTGKYCTLTPEAIEAAAAASRQLQGGV